MTGKFSGQEPSDVLYTHKFVHTQPLSGKLFLALGSDYSSSHYSSKWWEHIQAYALRYVTYVTS